MIKKKIIIFNAYGYYGGTLILSVLCKTLRELGYDARLYMTWDYKRLPYNKSVYIIKLAIYNIKNYIKALLCRLSPDLFKRYALPDDNSVSIPGLKFQINPFFSRKNSIIIYPEDLYGNPLLGKNVVRWFLYFYRYENTPKAYNNNDFFITYRDLFNSPKLNPLCNKVHLNYFNSQLYHQFNYGERKGKCYILRKGANREDLPNSFDGPVFNNNMSQKDLVRIFNEHKYCYSYDTQTFYTTIAAVCGCIPIIVMKPGEKETDYRKPGEMYYGQAIGDSPEQIQYAIKTRELRLRELDYKEHNKANTLHLIKLLEERFGYIKRKK